MSTLPTLPTLLLAGALLSASSDDTQPPSAVYPDPPDGTPPVLVVENADAASPEAMKPYAERIPGSAATFQMIPLPGGTFSMGSPESERKRGEEEGPVTQVRVDPFWIEVHEVTWDEYEIFMHKLDLQGRAKGDAAAVPQDAWADAVSRPTPPYMPMDFGMGIKGYPAVCMTQFAAKQYTKWLSMKTGRFYRLPTEAEWEYACRAGTTTAYPWGDDPKLATEYGWYFKNADDGYKQIMSKKPNPWGLYDMHGNVAEWVLDAWAMDTYWDRKDAGVSENPVIWPTTQFPRVVRGGSWDDDVEQLRSAARRNSRVSWQAQDPQLPKSIWYHTDAQFVGFRVVRPLAVPAPEEWAKYWEADLDAVREIQEKQRQGGR